MGQRLVIVSSPLDGCVYSLRLFVEICRFGAFSPGVVGFSSSSVCQFTVGRWWHLSSRKLFGVPVGYKSSSPLLGGVLFDLVPILSWVFSPGFGRGFLPLSGGTTPVWSSAAF